MVGLLWLFAGVDPDGSFRSEGEVEVGAAGEVEVETAGEAVELLALKLSLSSVWLQPGLLVVD